MQIHIHLNFNFHNKDTQQYIKTQPDRQQQRISKQADPVKSPYVACIAKAVRWQSVS